LPENRRCLASRGIVVYLEASIEQQVERTRRGRNRPLLHEEDPRTRLTELLRVREPLYTQLAQVTVTTDHRRVQAVAEHILAELKRLGIR